MATEERFTLSRSPQAVSALLVKELDAVHDPSALAALKAVLIEPALHRLEWEYGALDETRPCFIVGRDLAHDILLAYCEDGFGPTEQWGALRASDRSMGTDAQWYPSLYDAAIAAGVCSAPPGYEVP